jgi:hypothetical protein
MALLVQSIYRIGLIISIIFQVHRAFLHTGFFVACFMELIFLHLQFTILQFALILLWYLIKMFISFIWLLMYSRHKVCYISTNN